MVEYTLPSGEVIVENGIGVSYGIGQTKEQAEAQLKVDKEQRKQLGLREGTRGKPDEVPGPTTEGNQDNQGDDTGQVTRPPPDTILAMALKVTNCCFEFPFPELT